MSPPSFSLRQRRLAATAAVLLPAPAWAASGAAPAWSVYVLFVVGAIVVIALLLREALFTPPDEAPPRGAQSARAARYDAHGERARRGADVRHRQSS